MRLPTWTSDQLFNPQSPVGVVFLGALALVIASVIALLIRRFTRRLEARMSGASVLSVVAGLAAQDTLGNLIAGFSLVLSGAVHESDRIRLYCPVGTIDATVRTISLGFTVLLDGDGNEVVVPNSVIMNSAVVRIVHPAASAN